MAPQHSDKASSLESKDDSGSDSDSSGSENSGNKSDQGSGGSASRSPSPNSQGSPSPPGSPSSQTAGGARSPEDRRSRSPSPQGKSVRSTGSGSPSQRSGSGSPVGSEGRSRSGSPRNSPAESDKERSRSPISRGKSRSRSVSQSGSSRGSRSPSPASGQDADMQGSDSKPQRNSDKESSASPGAASQGSARSRSRSGSARSKSNSPRSEHEGSKTPKRSNGSRGSEHEGSKSPASKQSKTPESRRSGPTTPTGSPARSHQSRSRSGSQKSGSDSENENTLSKRKRAIVSDESGSDVEKKKSLKKTKNEDDEEGDKDSDQENLVIDAEALFGNASDISSEDEGGKKKKSALQISDDEGDAEKEVEESRRDSDAGSERAKSGDEAEETEAVEKDEGKETVPEEVQPETRIDVEIPKITTDAGKELHFVKLPNFLSVETRPFDKDTYEDEIDEEETLDEEGRARLKLKVENTIRWHEVTGKEGESIKESNARVVRWSDGSMSLHLGSEIFDVYKQPLQGDHNHWFIRQGTGLQGQAVFRTKLSFRPHSTESFTHRKMTMSLADRSQKTSGIKVLSLVGKDPEAHRGELIKKEEERLRASVRRESKQKRVREKGASRGLSAGYLEPDRYGDGDSDEEAISLNAIKKQHKNKQASKANIYSSDEEGSDIETRRARRLDKAKALKDSDSEQGSERSEHEGSASGDE